MKASNQKWIAWRRLCDNQCGVLECTGTPSNEAVEALQREWAREGLPTGIAWQICFGGQVDAESFCIAKVRKETAE
jgi:hypothetical protein